MSTPTEHKSVQYPITEYATQTGWTFVSQSESETLRRFDRQAGKKINKTFNLITFIQMKIEYNNLYTHFIFTTLHRQPLIAEKHHERIEKYITGIVNNNASHLYAIYANPEHVHFLTSRSPALSEEDLATTVADSSQKFINENKLCASKFEWQQSASAFSVSKSDIDKVCKYILNQPEHHRKVTFEEEYQEFIKHYQKTLSKK